MIDCDDKPISSLTFYVNPYDQAHMDSFLIQIPKILTIQV